MDHQDRLSECKNHIRIKVTSSSFFANPLSSPIFGLYLPGIPNYMEAWYKFKHFKSRFTVICWKILGTFFLFERPWILMISNSLYHISLHYQFFVPYFFTLPFLCTSLENALKKFSFLLTKLALCMHISGKFCLFFKLTLPCRFCFLGPNASR